MAQRILEKSSGEYAFLRDLLEANMGMIAKDSGIVHLSLDLITELAAHNPAVKPLIDAIYERIDEGDLDSIPQSRTLLETVETQYNAAVATMVGLRRVLAEAEEEDEDAAPGAEGPDRNEVAGRLLEALARAGEAKGWKGFFTVFLEALDAAHQELDKPRLAEEMFGPLAKAIYDAARDETGKRFVFEATVDLRPTYATMGLRAGSERLQPPPADLMLAGIKPFADRVKPLPKAIQVFVDNLAFQLPTCVPCLQAVQAADELQEQLEAEQKEKKGLSLGKLGGKKNELEEQHKAARHEADTAIDAFAEHAIPMCDTVQFLLSRYAEALKGPQHYKGFKPMAPDSFMAMAEALSPGDALLWLKSLARYVGDSQVRYARRMLDRLTAKTDLDYDGEFPEMHVGVQCTDARLIVTVKADDDPDSALRPPLEDFSKRFLALMGSKSATKEVKAMAAQGHKKASQYLALKNLSGSDPETLKRKQAFVEGMPRMKIELNKLLQECNRLQGLEYKNVNKIRTMRRIEKLLTNIDRNLPAEQAELGQRLHTLLEALTGVFDDIAKQAIKVGEERLTGAHLINSLDDLAKEGLNVPGGHGFVRRISQLAEQLAALAKQAQWLKNPASVPEGATLKLPTFTAAPAPAASGEAPGAEPGAEKEAGTETGTETAEKAPAPAPPAAGEKPAETDEERRKRQKNVLLMKALKALGIDVARAKSGDLTDEERQQIQAYMAKLKAAIKARREAAGQ